jgi:hypothetical protein
MAITLWATRKFTANLKLSSDTKVPGNSRIGTFMMMCLPVTIGHMNPTRLSLTYIAQGLNNYEKNTTTLLSALAAVRIALTCCMRS